jgi:putative SOS response-associated peptidase YedK
VITAAVITAASDGTGEADSPARLHDRMPLLVPPDRYDDWLDPAPADTAGLRHLLVPPDPARLVAYPVRTLVNSVANNGPELVEPAGEPARPGGEALDATLF